MAPARNQILFRLFGRGEGDKGAFHHGSVSQLIDAKFPDYHAIMPKGHNTRTVLDTAAFLRALKVASLFAHDASDRVVFTITPGSDTLPGQITLKATSDEAGDNVSDLDTLVEGVPIE